MAKTVETRVVVFSTQQALSRYAAERLVRHIAETLKSQENFHVALSGGTTPKILYQMLAGEFTDQIPWDRVHLFWGDERYVSQRDPRSNFRLIHEAILHSVHIPLGNIHPMPTHRGRPQDAAADYERFLRTQFKDEWPRFDAVLLGMGSDGHTASLFPKSAALAERERWVVATEASVDPKTRLTLTLPVINAAARVWFLVSGESKAPALASVLAGGPNARALPASAVRPTNGRLAWCVDEPAASALVDPLGDGVSVERGPEVSSS